ncbi:MAG: tyrosine-type recombinase/integrase [bacterium]|nr:tyrosine-type recombinase/integrase [bacterium]
MALSEFAARKAKSREKPYKLSDGGGLFLHVQPGGSKLWRLKYRYQGKEKLLSYGPYPQITIAEARIKREASKKLLGEGGDPSVQKKMDSIAIRAESRNTFGLIAEEYLENLAANDAAPSTLAKNKWLLQDVASPLTSRPIKDISSAEILDLLKRVEKSGRRETTRRLRGTISGVFRLAIVTLRADNDPTSALRGALLPPKPKGRAAIIDEADFGALLCSIDDYDGWPTISAALSFLILTCVRPGEVRGATRSEFDLAKAIWHIPAERMKMRRPHDVPLSRQALTILEDIWMLSDNAELVFPSIRAKKRPLSENAFNSAMRRMGYAKEEVTSHGFRVTASTILNSRGFDPDVIEAVLAHQDKNAIRRAYNRSSYWDQRVVLMQQWADLLDKFRQLKR